MLEQIVDALALAFEFGHLRAIELFIARQFDAQRIDIIVIDHDLVMQMRAGRQARIAEITDHLTLPDLHTFIDARGKGRQMIIGGDKIVIVLDLDAAAIA